jgi:hypothetical protein
VLEFVVKPLVGGGGSSVSATAYWHPAGTLGLLYWYALAPAHRYLLQGKTVAIARLAAADVGTASAGNLVAKELAQTRVTHQARGETDPDSCRPGS